MVFALPLLSHYAHVSSQVIFNPQGTRVLTTSSDKTARLWDAVSGKCLRVGFVSLLLLCTSLIPLACQVLEGHTDEVFCGLYNYDGNMIITGGLSVVWSACARAHSHARAGGKDNFCRIWR